MFNLELSDWLYLAGPIGLAIALLVALKISYSSKGFVPLSAHKPAVCWLPKYIVDIPLAGNALEASLTARLEHHGFRVRRRSADAIVFQRGSELGDFSIKIAKLIATVRLPISSPARMTVEYGVAFGCAFDTGDLWKFCNELKEKLETVHAGEAFRVETENPYQPPQT